MGNTVAPTLNNPLIRGDRCRLSLTTFGLPRSYVSRTQSVHETFELGQTKIVVEAHHPAALR